MRSFNPVREGLKRHATAHDYFLELKEKAAGRGMSPQEWDWFNARMKEWDPAEYEARRQASRHRMAMDDARRNLSIADLEVLIAEKKEAPDAG